MGGNCGRLLEESILLCGGGFDTARATGVAWCSEKTRRIKQQDQDSEPARLGDGPRCGDGRVLFCRRMISGRGSGEC